MFGSKSELLAVLRQYNPWWGGGRPADLPPWRRAAFREVFSWIADPPAHRALLLSGARQVGKTTLLLQTIDALLDEGVAPGKILYATFDHPLIKLAGLDGGADRPKSSAVVVADQADRAPRLFMARTRNS